MNELTASNITCKTSQIMNQTCNKTNINEVGTQTNNLKNVN